VVSGLADAVVEVTETGSTLRAHGLKIIYELMQTNTQFIANRDAVKDPWKQSKIDQIVLLLKGALRAENMVGLKMNLPLKNIDEVIQILPSLTAPTVAGLYNSEWVSVEVVVDSRAVRDLIPKLITAGAEGIIEYALNKVI
jgi:ATP phosphoribosyltransferase